MAGSSPPQFPWKSESKSLPYTSPPLLETKHLESRASPIRLSLEQALHQDSDGWMDGWLDGGIGRWMAFQMAKIARKRELYEDIFMHAYMLWI